MRRRYVLTGSIVNLSNIRARMIRFHTSIVKAEVVTISKLFVLEKWQQWSWCADYNKQEGGREGGRENKGIEHRLRG